MNACIPITAGKYSAHAKTLLVISSVLVGLTCATGVSAQGEVDFENFSNSFIYTHPVHNGPRNWTDKSVHHYAYYFALLEAPTSHITVDASLSAGLGSSIVGNKHNCTWLNKWQ